MADERIPVTSNRTYFNFIKPVRMLHQNVNKALDVRQFSFDKLSIVECQDGIGRSENHGSGWVCFTTAQNTDGSSAPQGFMSMDVTVEGELKHSLFVRGCIANNKNVSSAVSSQASGEGSLLLTVIADSTSLQVTKVAVSGRSHDGASSSISMQTTVPGDDPRKRKTPSSCSPITTQMSEPLNGPCQIRENRDPRDPRNGAKKERRRPDDECKYILTFCLA